MDAIVSVITLNTNTKHPVQRRSSCRAHSFCTVSMSAVHICITDLAIARHASESLIFLWSLFCIKLYSCNDFSPLCVKNCFLVWCCSAGGCGVITSCCTVPSSSKARYSLSRSKICLSLIAYNRTASISSGLTTLPACLKASLSLLGEKKASGWPLVRAASSRACSQDSHSHKHRTISMTHHAEHTHYRLYNKVTYVLRLATKELC